MYAAAYSTVAQLPNSNDRVFDPQRGDISCKRARSVRQSSAAPSRSLLLYPGSNTDKFTPVARQKHSTHEKTLKPNPPYPSERNDGRVKLFSPKQTPPCKSCRQLPYRAALLPPQPAACDVDVLHYSSTQSQTGLPVRVQT